MIARYIQDLAGDFHYFYTFSRVLNAEETCHESQVMSRPGNKAGYL
jgi:arginyl-tRNA synthetase